MHGARTLPKQKSKPDPLVLKTIYLFDPTPDKAHGGYVCGFLFRGKGAVRMQSAPITMPDFLAWVRATMPRPYPLPVNEERMSHEDRLVYDSGLTLTRTSDGVAWSYDNPDVAQEVAANAEPELSR